MRHIIPKNTQTIKLNFDVNEISSEDMPLESKKIAQDYLTSKTYNDEFDLIAATEDNQLIFGFEYLYKNQMRYIPELDPSVVYFSSAQLFREKIYKYKTELLKNSTIVIKMHENDIPLSKSMKQFETFFQFASSYIIMLNSSLEAFINKTIPIDYKYITQTGKEKNINWILKSAQFKTKIEEIIPDCTNKNFIKKFPKKYESIEELKNFRNELIHLSPKTDNTNTKYKEFYRKVIDFKYNESIYLVRDYINFHEENLIEECPCDQNFHFDINK
ncbi:hypothetical protein [uncultured Dokdonia sp.]|uniref:hypothetical protein n=1 Tax=uncultured Dokdonia sp. TaxID=575653 RepID=UPI0026116384|nr:hypothetical protein [uncultured Dokdonia sp.]